MIPVPPGSPASKGMRGAAVKEGKISHWYQGNGDRALFEAESPLMLRPQPDGSYARSRGELAVEPDPDLSKGTYGNWAHSPWWSLQALAEDSVVECRSPVWSILNP